jgi:intracellular septation protein A
LSCFIEFFWINKKQKFHQHMKSIIRLLKYLWRSLRNLAWALIVAFMLGIHNFYTGETKSKDDIVFTIEQEVIEEDAAPKD